MEYIGICEFDDGDKIWAKEKLGHPGIGGSDQALGITWKMDNIASLFFGAVVSALSSLLTIVTFGCISSCRVSNLKFTVIRDQTEQSVYVLAKTEDIDGYLKATNGSSRFATSEDCLCLSGRNITVKK